MLLILGLLSFLLSLHLKAFEPLEYSDSKEKIPGMTKLENEMKIWAKGYILPTNILQEFNEKIESEQFVPIIELYDYFFKAAKIGNLTALKYFEEKKFFDIDSHDSNGLCALQQAIYDNNEITCNFLLRETTQDRPSNYWLQTLDGRNLLMLINGCNDYKETSDNSFVLKMVKKLIELGLDINFQDDQGKTALMYHAPNLPVINLLISYGANIDLKDNNGKSFLDYFFKTISTFSDNNYYQKIVELIKIFKRYKIRNKILLL